MKINFFLFTIIVKRRTYNQEELEQMVRQEKLDREHQDRLAKMHYYRY